MKKYAMLSVVLACVLPMYTGRKKHYGTIMLVTWEERRFWISYSQKLSLR